MLRHRPHIMLLHHLMGLLGTDLVHVVLICHDVWVVHAGRWRILCLLTTFSHKVRSLIYWRMLDSARLYWLKSVSYSYRLQAP